MRSTVVALVRFFAVSRFAVAGASKWGWLIEAELFVFPLFVALEWAREEAAAVEVVGETELSAAVAPLFGAFWACCTALPGEMGESELYVDVVEEEDGEYVMVVGVELDSTSRSMVVAADGGAEEEDAKAVAFIVEDNGVCELVAETDAYDARDGN